MIKTMQVRETKYGNVLVLSDGRLRFCCFNKEHGILYLYKHEIGKLLISNYMFKRVRDTLKISNLVLLAGRTI